MKYTTLVIAVVLSLSAATNCQVYNDIDSLADRQGYNVEPFKTNSADSLVLPVKVFDVDVVKADDYEQEPFIAANYGQLPSEEVDVVRTGVKVPDYDLAFMKTADDVESKVAVNVESDPIKLADGDATNFQPLAGDDEGKFVDWLAVWEVENTEEGKSEVDSLEEALSNWWNSLAAGDDSESDESEESDESGDSEDSDESESDDSDDSEDSDNSDESESDESDDSEDSDDSESEESDEDEGDKYGFHYKVRPSFDKVAQWIQAVTQQSSDQEPAALAGDNSMLGVGDNGMLGDNSMLGDNGMLETDAAGASRLVQSPVDNNFEAGVVTEDPMDDGHDQEQSQASIERINVKPELKKQEADSQRFNDMRSVSGGRRRHLNTAFHYIFFAISGALFILGLMVIVGAIIKNIRYKKPGYAIMVEAGMSDKM